MTVLPQCNTKEYDVWASAANVKEPSPKMRQPETRTSRIG